MNPTLSANEIKLIEIENLIARKVCSVHGHLTKTEVDLCDSLRLKVGKSWDAINGGWRALEA